MATKAKTLQVKDKEKDDKAADAPEKDSPDAPSPLLDLSDAAVKKMIKQAKKRGFVTFDQLNEVLPSDTTSPEQIEDIMSMLSDMGINVSEAEDSDSEEETKEDAEDATTEIFMKVRNRLDQFDSSRPFTAWLYTVASNRLIDIIRSEAARRMREHGYARDVAAPTEWVDILPSTARMRSAPG